MLNRLLSVVAALSLAGCGSDHRAERDALEMRMQARLADLEARIVMLEKQPKLTFKMSNIEFQSRLELFQPLLDVSAVFTVSGVDIPQRFYMDVELSIEIPGEQFKATLRQVFMVQSGHAKVEMTHPLPVHGLTAKDMDISLRPLNWYPARVISENDVVVE